MLQHFIGSASFEVLFEVDGQTLAVMMDTNCCFTTASKEQVWSQATVDTTKNNTDS